MSTLVIYQDDTERERGHTPVNGRARKGASTHGEVGRRGEGGIIQADLRAVP
jgi:hypothetical protein